MWTLSYFILFLHTLSIVVFAKVYIYFYVSFTLINLVHLPVYVILLLNVFSTISCFFISFWVIAEGTLGYSKL